MCSRVCVGVVQTAGKDTLFFVKNLSLAYISFFANECKAIKYTSKFSRVL